MLSMLIINNLVLLGMSLTKLNIGHDTAKLLAMDSRNLKHMPSMRKYLL